MRERESEKALTPQEVEEVRRVIPYLPEVIVMVTGKRAITGVYRAIRLLCIWFIGASALAIAFKQSVLDLVSFIRGLFR